MKRLVCEMCGNTDLVKQNDLFVCQYCGAQYSLEEAKKMMVEGTVKVDQSDFVQKSLENARRAKSKEDWEECEKYYNIVEQHDPKNIEAIFYSAYGRTKAKMVEEDRFKKEQAIKVLKNSVSIVDDNYDTAPEKYEENKRLISQMNADLLALMNGTFVFTTTKQTTNGITTYTNNAFYTHIDFLFLSKAWIETLQNIINLMKKPGDAAYLWVLIRSQFAYQLRSGRQRGSFKKEEKESLVNQIIVIDQKIKELMPSYQPAPIPDIKTKGCYIATCVYGSYDCPQVWTLRRYRDETLAKKWYGRAFIRTYYAISPTLVRWFGNAAWFQKIWRGKLDHMVARLQSDGVESSPYED